MPKFRDAEEWLRYATSPEQLAADILNSDRLNKQLAELENEREKEREKRRQEMLASVEDGQPN
jgi:hypothetical protein